MSKEDVILGPRYLNVFAALDLPNPEMEQARVDLALAMQRCAARHRLSRREVARRTGLSVAQVRGLLGFTTLDEFTVEELARYLAALQTSDAVAPSVADG